MSPLAQRTRKPLMAALSLVLVVAAAGCDATTAGVKELTGSRSAAIMQVSTSPDRSDAASLDGSTLWGPLYIFVPSNVGMLPKQVEFFLDNPNMTGAATRVVTVQPYDFAGTAADGQARAWTAGTATRGSHKVTARWTYPSGSKGYSTASFTVGATTPVEPAATTTTTAPPATTTTTVPPTTTTVPPPPPPTTGGCPAYPAMPDASCTGWQHTGVTLSPYTGPMTITTNGTVIDGKDVPGTLTVNADNVTIKRSRVRGHINTGYGDNTGILIQDVEVNPGNDNGAYSAIGNSGFTCIRCNVYNAGQGFNITSSVEIRDSYVHDLYGTGSSHNEPIVSNGGGPFTIVHNNLVGNFNSASSGGGMSASLALYGDFSQIHDVLVQYNRFNLGNKGSFCLYAGSVPGKAYPNARNTRILNNRFGRSLQPSCGQYGPVTAYSSSNGNQWSGNVWDDSGAAVNP